MLSRRIVWLLTGPRQDLGGKEETILGGKGVSFKINKKEGGGIALMGKVYEIYHGGNKKTNKIEFVEGKKPGN